MKNLPIDAEQLLRPWREMIEQERVRIFGSGDPLSQSAIHAAKRPSTPEEHRRAMVEFNNAVRPIREEMARINMLLHPPSAPMPMAVDRAMLCEIEWLESLADRRK